LLGKSPTKETFFKTKKTKLIGDSPGCVKTASSLTLQVQKKLKEEKE